MIYELRYALGRQKKRLIEYYRAKNIQSIYSVTPNDSYNRIIALKNKFAGHRCFIVGNGPSLNELELKRLRSEYCIFFNGAFDLRAFTTEEKCIHVCEDRLVFEDHQSALNSLPGMVFFPSDLSHLVTSKNPIITEFHRGYSEKNLDWPKFVDKDSQYPIFYWGGTVAYYGLQIAQWLGFSEINIIGVDLTYKIPDSVEKKGSVLTSTSDDPNHYKSSYFGKGLRWHVPQPDRMLRAFETHSNSELLKNVNNAGIGGNLNCFQRVSFDELFNK
jgi:hypothetical protein